MSKAAQRRQFDDGFWARKVWKNGVCNSYMLVMQENTEVQKHTHFLELQSFMGWKLFLLL